MFFNPNTANIPSSNKYGVCVYSNHCDNTNTWINATAYQTDGTVCISSKVNQAAWSNWVRQPTRDEVDALSSRLTLSSKATSVNAWTNDTNAVFEIVGETKKFSITIASNGTLSGSVTNL